MKITVTGIEETIAKLEKVEHPEKLIHQAIHEAIKEAENIVLDAYDSQSDVGNNDYKTAVEEMPNGYKLTVSGTDVGFLEFGAGWGVMTDEFEEQADYDVAVGSYSDIEMGQFFRTGHRFWWYVDGGQKQFFRYISPTRGMQRALDYLRSNLASIVKEKIDEWIGN